MFDLVKKNIIENWKIITLIVASPLIAFSFNAFIKFIFNTGYLFGTFLRICHETICVYM